MNPMLFPNARFARTFGDIAGDFDRIFGRVLGDDGGAVPVGGFAAHLDVVESDSEWELSMDLPGVRSEDVNVEVNEGRLTISGTRSIPRDGEGRTYHRSERFTGEFTRRISLPKGVDQSGVSAELADGVLVLRLPKRPEEKPRKIEIRSSQSVPAVQENPSAENAGNAAR